MWPEDETSHTVLYIEINIAGGRRASHEGVVSNNGSRVFSWTRLTLSPFSVFYLSSLLSLVSHHKRNRCIADFAVFIRPIHTRECRAKREREKALLFLLCQANILCCFTIFCWIVSDGRQRVLTNATEVGDE
jgi:hypothetical protein